MTRKLLSLDPATSPLGWGWGAEPCLARANVLRARRTLTFWAASSSAIDERIPPPGREDL